MIFDQIVMAIIGGGTIQVDILSNGSRAIQMPFETDNIKEKPSHDFSSHIVKYTFLVGKKTTLYLGARVANLKS